MITHPEASLQGEGDRHQLSQPDQQVHRSRVPRVAFETVKNSALSHHAQRGAIATEVGRNSGASSCNGLRLRLRGRGVGVIPLPLSFPGHNLAQVF